MIWLALPDSDIEMINSYHQLLMKEKQGIQEYKNRLFFIYRCLPRNIYQCLASLE
jgi:hypothetical protein